MNQSLYTGDREKTLTEAIIRGCRLALGKDFPEQFRLKIRDFLARRFHEVIKKRPDLEPLLIELFDECTRR